MAYRRGSDGGRTAATMLAVSIVSVLGLAACLLIVLTTADQPNQQVWIALGVFGGVWMVVFLMRLRKDDIVDRLDFFAWKPEDETAAIVAKYQPRPEAAVDRPTVYGSNQPPSVETIRELKKRYVHWVPASSGQADGESTTEPRRSDVIGRQDQETA